MPSDQSVIRVAWHAHQSARTGRIRRKPTIHCFLQTRLTQAAGRDGRSNLYGSGQRRQSRRKDREARQIGHAGVETAAIAKKDKWERESTRAKGGSQHGTGSVDAYAGVREPCERCW